MKPNHLLALALLAFISCKAQDFSILKDGAELSLVSEGFEFTEGPAADAQGNVFFTDQPNNKILRWNASDNSISEYMNPAGRSNGLYVDHQGNLLSCADKRNQLWQIDAKKKVTVLVNNFEGKRLNGPNDLWIDPKGGIYFTDPFYQRPYWDHTAPEIKAQRVYYLSAKNKLSIAATDFVRPNGIIGTADGKTLYIADIGDDRTYSYSVDKDGTLTNKKLFVPMGSDGMTLDHRGNLYLTGDGVTVFNKVGAQILHIPVPKKWTANATFGGINKDLLFITAMDAVFTIKTNVHGVGYETKNTSALME